MPALFDPRLVNDVFGDPGLLLDIPQARRALLFDLGDIGALTPAMLMRLSHVFVSHTHMDHFAGFDHLLRVLLGRKAGIVIYGGPDFLAQVEHKLRAYTWNVAHRYAVELVIEARELPLEASMQRSMQCARFSSRRGFAREPAPTLPCTTDVIHDETTFRIRARFVDHEMPCLAYVIEQQARLAVPRGRLAALELTPGAWLRDLRHAVLSGAPRDAPILVQWRDRHGDHAQTRQIGELSQLIIDRVRGERIGYVTDLRYTEANVQALCALMQGVDRLFIECVFLERDRAHALRKNHLTALQAGLIARRIGARDVVPFHFSARYRGHEPELIDEMRAAWHGACGIGRHTPG